VIVGTAGHIDHGKSTLVRALTGVDTDRLPEEKARGISIDLGYAYVPIDDDNVLGFIDVPGHERLVHTMVAGATGIDFALLVVAADDGVMPQTREHLAILQLLGVDHGAVALTKVDRVDAARIAEVSAEIGALLEATPLRGAPLYALDATTTGTGALARLKAHLRKAAAVALPHRTDGLFRLAVDRVFTLAGHGTVVTGTVHGGQCRVGDLLVVMPRGRPVRVRSIHAQNRPADHADAGQRCALNLAGVDTDQVVRGDWIADPRALAPTRNIDVLLRGANGKALGGRNLTALHVHLGTADHLARIVPLERDTGDRDAIRAQLVFDNDVCATPGDRFIARDARAATTLGGGIVLDPYAPPRRRRTPARLAWLDALVELVGHGDIEPLLAQAEHGLVLSRLAQLTGLAPERIVLPADARVIEAGDDRIVIHALRWNALRASIVAVLERFHAENADEPGVDGARLRRMAIPAATEVAWRGLVRELLREGAIVRSGAWLHLPVHRVSWSERELALAQTLEHDIVEAGIDPPWLRNLAKRHALAEGDARRLLRKCVAQGRLYQVVPDLFYGGERMRELAQALRRLAHDQPKGVTAASFRDAIGIGRKRAIQILEFFDRIGFTRRMRDAHVLRADSDWNV